MNAIQEEQRRRNRACRDCWQLYRPHREKVMDLLLRGATDQDQRLCLLGAGNCNDLDLNRLTDHFQEVSLVDIDGEALAAGVAAQQVSNQDRIQIHADVDLTGIVDWLAERRPESSPDGERINQCVERALHVRPITMSAPQDVAASVCLLSQLVESIKIALGEGHPTFLEMVKAVRLRHLRLLVEMARPDGRAVLITDFVSSATCPTLPDVSESQLAEFTARLIRERNFFTGLNPFVLQSLFTSDPWLLSNVESVRLIGPWRWQFPTRVYAVCAIEATRKPNAGVGPVPTGRPNDDQALGR
jgi:hypothetical protein